jgi:hypothetical protein
VNRYYQRFKSPSERFWEKVGIKGIDDCWLWLASITHDNYGRFSLQQKQVMAHRMAWQLTNGEIPNGFCVCHSCDNPPCCNPKHLWLGTHIDNQQDMCAKFRRNGVINGNAKLSDTAVIKIRGLYEMGWNQRKIAKMYGVHRKTVSRIITRKNWNHI